MTAPPPQATVMKDYASITDNTYGEKHREAEGKKLKRETKHSLRSSSLFGSSPPGLTCFLCCVGVMKEAQ